MMFQTILRQIGYKIIWFQPIELELCENELQTSKTQKWPYFERYDDSEHHLDTIRNSTHHYTQSESIYLSWFRR